MKIAYKKVCEKEKKGREKTGDSFFAPPGASFSAKAASVAKAS